MTHALKMILLNYIEATPETRLVLKSIPVEGDLLDAFGIIDLAISQGKIEGVKEITNSLITIA